MHHFTPIKSVSDLYSMHEVTHTTLTVAGERRGSGKWGGVRWEQEKGGGQRGMDGSGRRGRGRGEG